MRLPGLRLADPKDAVQTCGDCNRLRGHAPDCTYARVILGDLLHNPEWKLKHGAKYGVRTKGAV